MDGRPVASVRAACAADEDVVCEFNARLAEESERRRLDPATLRAGVRAALGSPERGRYFVAEVAGRVVGQLLVTTEWSDWRNGWFWWIQSVYVAPAARRNGVYRRLHEEVERMARARDDVRGLRLYVEESNGHARATYARLGMLRTGYLLYETDWSAATAPA
jgi:GNAT superfamily N-acetyltransferase